MLNELRRLRRKHDITQVELAKKLEISRQTIIDIEKNKRNPSLELALKIATFFNVKVEEIFFIPNVIQVLQKDKII